MASSWLKLASSWLKLASSWPEMASSCLELAQVGLKWLKLAPSWLQVGSSWTQDQLREPPGGSPGGSWEGPGRVLGGTWSQEALLEAPEVPKWPPGDSKIYEKSIKLISDLKALASEWSEWSGILDLGSEGFSSSEIWDLRALASESSKWSGILDLRSEWSSTDGGFSPHLYV